MEANRTSAPDLVSDIRIGLCRISDFFMGKAGDVVYSHETGQKAFLRQPHPSTRLQHVAEHALHPKTCPKPKPLHALNPKNLDVRSLNMNFKSLESLKPVTGKDKTVFLGKAD